MAAQHPFQALRDWKPNPALEVNGTMRVNATWTPPPWQDLNFTADYARCDIATKYTARLAREVSNLESWPDVPMGYAVNYTWMVLPDNARNVTVAQLLSWCATFDYWAQPAPNGTAAVRMLQLPLQRCGKQICENLDWAGDSDITGVGMMISYYLAILLLTLYFVMLLIARLPSVKRACRENKWLRRCMHSYTESTGTFLDSALVFSIAMLAAAITRYSSYMRNPDKSQSVYALFGSTFMSTFSIFIPVVLQSVHSGLRRHHVRQFMWLVLISLAITVQVFYRRVYKNRSWSTNANDWEWTGLRANTQFAELIWLRLCDPRATRDDLENLLTGAHIVLAANAAVWLLIWTGYLIFKLGLSKEGKERLRARRDGIGSARHLSLAKKAVVTFNAIACLLLAWALLGYFHGYRTEVSDIAKESNMDLNWTFGQVLAMATWAPVLVDNTSIYIHGSTDGLTSHLPKGYKAVREDGRTESEANSEKSEDSGLPFVNNQTPRPSGQHERFGALHPQHQGRWAQSGSEASTMQ